MTDKHPISEGMVNRDQLCWREHTPGRLCIRDEGHDAKAEESVDGVTVSWYSCDCPWLTKYCDEEHRKYAVIPRTVLEQYAVEVKSE